MGAVLRRSYSEVSPILVEKANFQASMLMTEASSTLISSMSTLDDFRQAVVFLSQSPLCYMNLIILA